MDMREETGVMRLEYDDATHTYLADGVKYPSVTEVLPKQPGHDFVSADRMAQTSEDGKYRHHRISRHLLRADGEEITELSGLEVGVDRFISEHPEFGAFVGSEKILVSRFRYAGTADILFENAVVDVKRTIGNKRIHSLQCAGYHTAAVESGIIGRNQNWWILQIDDNGKYKAVNVFNALAEPLFLSLVKAWWNPEQYIAATDAAVNQYINS